METLTLGQLIEKLGRFVPEAETYCGFCRMSPTNLKSSMGA